MAGRLENPVIVTGFAELERDLKASTPALLKGMRAGLDKGAEEVKREAERIAQDGRTISGMKRAKQSPPPWSIPRIGQTTREVYMVPVEKGARARAGSARRRPNFANIMLGKVYDPALERKRAALLRQVNLTIDTVTREF